MFILTSSSGIVVPFWTDDDYFMIVSLLISSLVRLFLYLFSTTFCYHVICNMLAWREVILMMNDDESVVNLSRSQALHSQYSHINTNKYFLFGVTLSCKPTFLMTHANLGRP